MLNRVCLYENDGNTIIYRFINYKENDLLNELIKKIEKTTEELIIKKNKKISISYEIEQRKEISQQILDLNNKNKIKQRNILRQTTFKDEKIGHGKDSSVYGYKKQKYVYKEGKESNERNLLYLRNKYIILKKYLGNVIPDSKIVLGESFENTKKKGLGKINISKIKSLTIQKRVDGKNLQKMDIDEKTDINFLNKLEEEHKKYILLKFFLKKILNDLGFNKKEMDVQLDLGKLSVQDSFDKRDHESIENDLRSPNIMWDGKKIYFIDFGGGEWNENKEIIFNKLMEPQTIKKWENILENIL